MKKTIMIDLDGVLNVYNGNYTENSIPPIKEGAKEFIEKIAKDYEIKLFTTREYTPAQNWLIENGLDKYIVDITNKKEPAWLYIDDRAVTFDGDYNNLYKQVTNFKVWYKK